MIRYGKKSTGSVQWRRVRNQAHAIPIVLFSGVSDRRSAKIGHQGHALMSDPGRTCSLPACDHFRSFGNVSPSSFRLHCHCEAFSPRFVACPQLPSPRTSLRRKHLAYCLNETSFREGELDSIISPPEPGVPLSSSGVASRI